MTYVMMIYETERAFAERTDPAKSEKYWGPMPIVKTKGRNAVEPGY